MIGHAAAVIALLAVATPAQAQDGPDAVCMRARPGEHCRGFIITEFVGAIGPATKFRRPPLNFVWDAGYARHLDARTALGASLTLIADEDDRVMIGIRPRYRRWLGRSTSLDIAPAILLAHTDPGGIRVSYPSLSAAVGLGVWDLVGVTAQLEILRHGGSVGTQTALTVGVRLGSYAGLIAGPAAAVFTAYVKSIGD